MVQQLPPPVIDSMMEVDGPDVDETQLTFIIEGEPKVQERHRIAWKGILGAWRRKKRASPIIYDPSAKDKRDLRLAVKAAMQEIEITSFPYYNADEPLVLELFFFFEVRPNQVFPKKKDLDNMVKYIMDALTGVIYPNDTAIVSLAAEKTFEAHNSTMVSISRISRNI